MSKSLLRVRLGYFWLRRVGGVGRVINGVIMRLDGVRTVPLPSRGRTDQKENILELKVVMDVKYEIQFTKFYQHFSLKIKSFY